jgi:RNA polymerase sigma-70 factor (ECF subfamily)
VDAQALGVDAEGLGAPWVSWRARWQGLAGVLARFLRREAGMRGALVVSSEDERTEEEGAAAGGESSLTAAREIAEAVVERARRGDHGAFREIVDHYESRLRVLAYHLLHDADQMSDVLQDTFVKAYAGLPDYRGEAALGTWLYRICYRTCLDRLRRRRVRPVQTELDDGLADPADDAERVALRNEVAVALGGLPAEQRAVLLLVDRDGYDYGSVAEILEVPVGTVASRLSAARTAMRRALRPTAPGREVQR